MKNSIAHLPVNKIHDLQNIVSIIREGCGDVEMIILYGSYARGNYKEAVSGVFSMNTERERELFKLLVKPTSAPASSRNSG